MTPELLARTLEDFLADARDAVVLEDGAAQFELATARYSVSADHGRCLLHIWSEERNAVRRVVDAEMRHGNLSLKVLRFGRTQPITLEICRDRDLRTPSARKAERLSYQKLLGRVLERRFAGFKVEHLSSAMDLERSFGPAYCRGVLRQGRAAFAVLGVNSQEPQATVDASLSFALLWLDACRQNPAHRAYFEGLMLFVPPKSSAMVRERMAHLDREIAKWRLYELDERDELLAEVDCRDRGNVETRLVRCPDEGAARERFAHPIAEVCARVPYAEAVVLSSAEIAFRLHGLEFARARLAPEVGSFRNAPQVVFGFGGGEHTLGDHNAAQFTRIVERLVSARTSPPRPDDPVWRACPERWLESLVTKDVSAIDDRLDHHFVYSQVPAFAASDRAMIDVLTVTRQGRLAVVELKAGEDIHLPMQGLDYWARVVWHQQRGDFGRFGYFAGCELSPEPPLLYLVAPALRIHPSTDALLRYVSSEIDWTLVAVDERWRDGVRVIFRKQAKAAAA